jgi:hypothetical protein
MKHYSEREVDALVKQLLWTRRYHLRFLKEIDAQLKELSTRYGIMIPLDADERSRTRTDT